MNTELKKPERTIFGKIVKWSFIGFNLLMLYWFVAGMAGASASIDTATSEAEKAGATIGTGLGAMMIIFVWCFGTVILGTLTYFTKAKN